MAEQRSLFSGKHKADGTWVNQLGKMVGQSVYERFLICSAPEVRVTSGGVRQFMTVELGDKTGRIKLFVWSMPPGEEKRSQAILEQGKVYALTALVREYKGKLQLSINNWEDFVGRGKPFECAMIGESGEGDYFEEDFCMIPSDWAALPVADMWQDIRRVIDEMKNAGYRELILAVLEEEGLASAFKKWPAAKFHHHAFFGGLLQHVHEMILSARATIAHNPGLNADLLFAGIILHDIGKIQEYRLGQQIEYVEEAGLLGHMVIAIQMIERTIKYHNDKIKNLGADDLRNLYHLILSHHGPTAEGFGSAIDPQLPEAIALYHLDQLSAKTNAAWQEMKRKQ